MSIDRDRFRQVVHHLDAGDITAARRTADVMIDQRAAGALRAAWIVSSYERQHSHNHQPS